MRKSKREKLIPYQRTHPGLLLAKEIESRGMTIDGFLAEFTDYYQPPMLMKHTLLGNPYYLIHPTLAIYAEKRLGIDADVWVNANAQWELWYWRVINCQVCGVKMDSVLATCKVCDKCGGNDDEEESEID